MCAIVTRVVTDLDAESGLPNISGVRFEVRGFSAGKVRVLCSIKAWELGVAYLDAESGLPLSRDSRMASSWVFCSIRSANLYRTAPRSRPVIRGQGPWSKACQPH